MGWRRYAWERWSESSPNLRWTTIIGFDARCTVGQIVGPSPIEPKGSREHSNQTR